MAPLASGRLPADFVATHKRRRILKALAELLVEKGYRGTRIADIVKRAGVARKTFYDNFGGKDDAVRALVEQALPDLYERVDLASIERTGLGLFAVELAAEAKTDEGSGAARRARAAGDALDDIAASICPPEPVSEMLCTLPPGRHGLPHEFVASNQRVRLLHSFSAAVVERGYLSLRVEDVTRLARLSRRSFYEQFPDMATLARALAATASAPAAALLDDIDPNSGLGALVVEVVAAEVSNAPRTASSVVAEAGTALQSITNADLELVAA